MCDTNMVNFTRDCLLHKILFSLAVDPFEDAQRKLRERKLNESLSSNSSRLSRLGSGSRGRRRRLATRHVQSGSSVKAQPINKEGELPYNKEHVHLKTQPLVSGLRHKYALLHGVLVSGFQHGLSVCVCVCVVCVCVCVCVCVSVLKRAGFSVSGAHTHTCVHLCFYLLSFPQLFHLCLHIAFAFGIYSKDCVLSSAV